MERRQAQLRRAFALPAAAWFLLTLGAVTRVPAAEPPFALVADSSCRTATGRPTSAPYWWKALYRSREAEPARTGAPEHRCAA